MVKEILIGAIIAGLIAMGAFLAPDANSDDQTTISDPGYIETDYSLKFCPICQKEGLKSKVYIGWCTITALNCGNGHYDEDGHYHPPEPCNTMTCEYTCSNDHPWSESE